jgi:hypothetical protein
MGAVVRRAWTRWKVIARVIGNFQARLLLSLFYFLVIPPFGLIVKLFKDPLMLRPPQNDSLWVTHASSELSWQEARRQF